jgi:hypothetical protein
VAGAAASAVVADGSAEGRSIIAPATITATARTAQASGGTPFEAGRGGSGGAICPAFFPEDFLPMTVPFYSVSPGCRVLSDGELVGCAERRR